MSAKTTVLKYLGKKASVTLKSTKSGLGKKASVALKSTKSGLGKKVSVALKSMKSGSGIIVVRRKNKLEKSWNEEI